MNKYEIYWADVPFEDSDESKLRPILILNDVALVITALKITSKGKSTATQIEISNWKGAGLSKQSYICIDKCLRLDKSAIGEKIGELQLIDKYMLQKALMK